jgi:hypothetical protein
VRVKLGRPVTIRGQLVFSGRRPAEGVPITVPGGMPAERRLWLAVPASSTIKASRLRLRGAGVVRFRGSVRGGAGANLVVVLQGKENGMWRTFADTRTRKAGRWSASYRFSGRPGDYPIRVRVRRQANQTSPTSAPIA